jgi:dihydroorotase
MVSRDLDILRYAGGRLHFSVVSTAGTVELIKKAKNEGLNVTCDIASYQPLLSDDLLTDYDTNLKVSPPLRNKATNKKLLRALKEGAIDVLTSNHTPQDLESKKLEFDLAEFGIIGLQTFGANLVELSSSISWEDIIEKITVNPRNLLNIPVPEIEEGALAEITLFDPSKVWMYDNSSNFSKSSNSPWLGRTLTGKAKAVFNSGKHWIDQ